MDIYEKRYFIVIVIEGSLDTKVPKIWTDQKHSHEEAEPGRNSDVEKVRREKIRDGESQKREEAGAQKVRKSRNIVWLRRLAKAAGAEPAGQIKDEKLHTVAARSTFEGQNQQSTSGPERISKLRCRNKARHCGAKRVLK